LRLKRTTVRYSSWNLPIIFLGRWEPIDVENDEYLFGDARGAAVRIELARGAVKQILPTDQQMTFGDAFPTYAKAFGLKTSEAKSPLDAWRMLQSQLPPKRSLSSRLFGRGQV
jgi:hypothetical protein